MVREEDVVTYRGKRYFGASIIEILPGDLVLAEGRLMELVEKEFIRDGNRIRRNWTVRCNDGGCIKTYDMWGVQRYYKRAEPTPPLR